MTIVAAGPIPTEVLARTEHVYVVWGDRPVTKTSVPTMVWFSAISPVSVFTTLIE